MQATSLYINQPTPSYPQTSRAGRRRPRLAGELVIKLILKCFYHNNLSLISSYSTTTPNWCFHGNYGNEKVCVECICVYLMIFMTAYPTHTSHPQTSRAVKQRPQPAGEWISIKINLP